VWSSWEPATGSKGGSHGQAGSRYRSPSERAHPGRQKKSIPVDSAAKRHVFRPTTIGLTIQQRIYRDWTTCGERKPRFHGGAAAPHPPARLPHPFRSLGSCSSVGFLSASSRHYRQTKQWVNLRSVVKKKRGKKSCARSRSLSRRSPRRFADLRASERV
jgi:hypothetical protein